MSTAEVRKALEARTLPEIEQAEDALRRSNDPEAPYAAEQLQMMRLALESKAEEQARRKALDDLGLGDLP